MLSQKEILYTELLVIRCQRQDQQAWRELVERWEKPLFFYIRRLLDNEPDAWDALQETWSKAFRGLHALRDPRCFAAWVYSIARRAAIDRARAGWPLRGANEIDCAAADFAGSDAEEECSDAILVHQALEKLSLASREVLTLFFLQDLSLDEIAQVLQIPTGTVKSRLFYAKQQLRQMLQEA